MRILIFGATGMLGSQLSRSLQFTEGHSIHCVIRNKNDRKYIRGVSHLVPNLFDEKILDELFNHTLPDVVINCCGSINYRHSSATELDAGDIKSTILINSYFPHLLDSLSRKYSSRLILFSTDCVFSGNEGSFFDENSRTSPSDLYGKSKLLGEISESLHVLTLRTSIIGHEVKNMRSLLEWFLGVEEKCYGYRNAIFTGLTTNEVANVIIKYILPNQELSGLLHLSGHQISKYDLLLKIAEIYKKKIDIIPSEFPAINRSLDGSKFSNLTGYSPPSWTSQITAMYNNN